MLNERDYMRKPIEAQSAEHPDQQLPTQKPFDIFEGLLNEPLPTVHGEVTEKPSGKLIQQNEGLPLKPAEELKLELERSNAPEPKTGRRAIYALIAFLAGAIGILVGLLLK